MKIHSIVVGVILVVASVLVADNVQGQNKATGERPGAASEIGTGIDAHVHQMLKTGRRAFRFDTFGSEAFWGETLQLHKAIAGEKNGGVGGGGHRAVLRQRSAAVAPEAHQRGQHDQRGD